MMNKSTTIAFSLGWIILLNALAFVQCKAQSNTKAFPLSNKRFYVLIPTADSASTHVKTKRIRKDRTEYLDIINIFLPTPFVSQKLIQTHDIILANGLLRKDKFLITMTVLPHWQTGQVNWIPIRLDTIATRQIPWQTVTDDCYTRLFNYEAAYSGGVSQESKHRRMNFYPIIKYGNNYFTTAQQVLTEYFIVRNNPTWYPTSSDNATINCLSKPFTPVDYSELLEAVNEANLPTYSKPSIKDELLDKLLLRQVEGQIYTFWSLPHSVSHRSIYEFGAVEFKFNPKIGLVSGKYPDYFELSNNSSDNTFFNVINIELITGR